MPFALRFLLVKEPRLLRKVERRLVEAIFRWQRRRAKELGATGKSVGGAVSFVQLFGSALQLQPHVHLLCAEGVWSDGVFMALPPPAPEEVERVLERALCSCCRTSRRGKGGGRRTSTRRSWRSRRNCACLSMMKWPRRVEAGSR